MVRLYQRTDNFPRDPGKFLLILYPIIELIEGKGVILKVIKKILTENEKPFQ